MGRSTLTVPSTIAEMRTSTFDSLRGFRRDIEGLRAVAVLLVIAAHYEMPGFSGGFIGVDIFFVISGYLITGILVREYAGTGRIDLLRFYANRLRRLLPALLTMVLLSSVAIAWILPVDQQPTQGHGAAMAMLWVSNVLFAFANADYFAAETSSNVFLHTWSLGVEEQFYLIWPLLLLLALRQRSQKCLGRLLVVLAVASLTACVWLTQNQPILAFYMMPTRAWQFSAGGLIWLCASRAPPTAVQAQVASGLGLAALVVSLTAIGPTSLYPGAWALLPTAACTLLLWAGSSNSRPGTDAALCHPTAQRIGRLSYAWYLWHWPVLVVGEQLLPIRSHPANTALALGLSLLAAVATHHFIEKPIRFGRSAQIRHTFQMSLSVGLMVLASWHLMRWSGDAESLASNNRKASELLIDNPTIYNDGCDDYYRSDRLKPCIYGNVNAQKSVVLFGDSIGAQWFPALTTLFNSEDWKIIVLTKSSCPMVDEPSFLGRIGREYTECTVWRNRAIGWLQQRHVQHLFVGGSAARDFSPQQWTEGTSRILDQLAPHADAIHVIGANPILSFDGPSCLREKPHEQCQSSPANPERATVAKFIKMAVARQPKASWLETSDFVCPENHCEAIRDVAGNKIVVFRDNQHLTASFVATAASYFRQQMSVPISASHQSSHADNAIVQQRLRKDVLTIPAPRQ
ncbi:MAG: acyltransferase [Comamonadaceae bacterium]|nr:MAG: acyltransferase [Comamonadaceae bacterium]